MDSTSASHLWDNLDISARGQAVPKLGKGGLGDFWSASRSRAPDLLYCLADDSEIPSLKCLGLTPLYPDPPWSQTAPPTWLAMLCHHHEIRTVWPWAAFLSTALPSSSNRWVYFWSHSSCRRHSPLRISGLGIKSGRDWQRLIGEGFTGLFPFQSFTI